MGFFYSVVRHLVEPSEYFALLAAGLPVGLVLLAVLSGRDREAIRRRVARWCLWFGALSAGILGLAALFGIDLVPTRGVLGMAFVGLPALTSGMLMSFFGRPWRRTTEPY